jgi:hypothetical protein
MIIIPIGIDCSISSFLIRNGLRKISLPFDWVVTYTGVHDIIDDLFKDYIPDCHGSGKILNKNYNVLFIHDNFPEDKEKYIRRINRLNDILTNSDEEVIFMRRSHLTRHHDEYDNITNDFEDSKKLSLLLQDKYPKLKFKIVLILMCGECFNHNINYEYQNIEVYNISSNTVDNCEFDSFMDKIVTNFKN